MSREKYSLEGLESGVDDGLAELEQLEPRDPNSYISDYAKGYKTFVAINDRQHTEEEIEHGCEYLGELDLDDMFGAFAVENYGIIGGGVTVDDFTPEGLEDRIGGRALTGEPGGRKGIGGATGDKIRSKSSVPEERGGYRTKAVHSGSGNQNEMGHKYP